MYTPRWAHTDDNHAWVEAWADGKWYFLGACEPEPVLNLGWFNAPASRGMLMHTKVFGRYEGPEEVMAVTPSYTEINVIDNYAPTAKAVVVVKDVDGRIVEGAQVDFKVYNYAEFFTVATKTTDKNGCASLTAGKGDMLVWASKDGRFGYAKCSFGKDKELTLVLSKQEGETYKVDLDIVPPVEGANLPEVSDEQRQENDARMAQEDAIRNAYVATMMDEKKAVEALKPFGLKGNSLAKSIQMLVASRGNYQTLLDFFQFAHEQGKAEHAAALLNVLSEKDWRDVPLEVLKDHFVHTAMKEGMSLEDWSVLANPRVDVEMLTPYRSFFLNQFSKEEAAAFVESPAQLVDWCIEHIEVDNALNVQRIPVSPVGVWKARKADERSRNIFFVSVARSLGIYAQIDAVTGKVQYVEPRDGKLYDVNFAVRSLNRVPTGTLKAAYRPIKSLSDPKYYSHFTLSKFKDGRFQLLSYDEGDVDMGGGATWGNLLKEGLRLDVGYYMLITGTRMASGAVLSQISFFTIEEGKETKVQLVMRESKDQVQVIGNFNSESLFQPVGEQTSAESLLQACGRGYFVVGVLGVGQEPTNHALRDIAALRGEFEKWGRQMVLLFPSEEQYKKFRPEEFPGLPSTIQYGIDIDNSIQKQIYETMKLSSKNTLPMFIIADTFNRVVFVSQGYTIGLGEQLMKVVHGL
ncbi:transglutaminase-family protein [gut metagenome]|uniref:Transglutaminase-family protein n=1 Tax=gut metagenome TaxID=749906 RepID=J9FLT8_9ZZZZ